MGAEHALPPPSPSWQEPVLHRQELRLVEFMVEFIIPLFCILLSLCLQLVRIIVHNLSLLLIYFDSIVLILFSYTVKAVYGGHCLIPAIDNSV